MDDVVEFPRARTKPLSEDEALERLRQAGRIEGIGTFAELVGWERTGASRVVGQWERDGKVVRTPRPGYPTVIEAVVAGVPAVHTAIAPPVLHTPAQAAQPVTWWRRVVGRRAHPVAHPAHPVPHAARRPPPLARVFFALGGVLGVVGLAVDVTFAVSYAPDSVWRCALQALTGAGIYTFATALPVAARELWRRDECWTAVLAWGVWPVMIGLSLMAATGFSATNISDVLAKRSVVVTQASNTATRASNTAADIKRWREERDGIAEKRSVDEIKLQLLRERRKVDRIDRDAFNATFNCTRLTVDTEKACGPVLPLVQALTKARDRDELTRKINTAEEKQEGKTQGEGQGAPIIGSVDPQAESLSKLVAWVTRGLITPTPDDIALVRILGLTIVPSLSGLAFLFAFALSAPRTTPQSRGGMV